MVINSLSDIEYLLPTLNEDTFNDTVWGETQFLECQLLASQYQLSLKQGDFHQAAETLTKLIEFTKRTKEHHSFDLYTFYEMHLERARCYVLAKEYDAALDDIAWISAHAPLRVEQQLQSTEALIQLMQGNKDPLALHAAAAHGDLIALLLLNEPENPSRANPEWALLVPPSERIKQLLAERHYAQALELISPENTSYICEGDQLAAAGVCYALQGNWVQALKNLTEANHRFGARYTDELALVYSMAGFKERALKVLDHPAEFNVRGELVRQWIESIHASGI
ncbi:MAG TPA: hypothetical protein VLF94_01145 [Chlamydiales bacterium]|nr:hypothetical protein [Chlamydiales bacterium]